MNLIVERRLIELRFHGRGGQGAVTAAHVTVDSAVRDGFWGTAFPFFGAERRGAPVTAFARLSCDKVVTRSMVRNPDVVVVLDPSIMNYVNVFDGLKNHGIVVINSSTKPNISREVKLYTVNATKIALDLGLVLAGWPLVNIAMVGALSRILGIRLSSVLDSVRSMLSGRMAELNMIAAERAYHEVSDIGGG